MADSSTPADGSKPASGSQANESKDPVISAKTFALTLPDGAGHKGTLTVNDNAPIESIILAYQVVHELADHISARVIALNTAKLPVFFHNAADFAAVKELRSCLALCREYETLFGRLAKEAKELLAKPLFGQDEQLNIIGGTAIAGFAIFSGLLSSGLQLLSLFRTDQEIKSYKIEIEDQVLAVTVAGHLKQHGGFEVYHSAIVPVDPLGESHVMKRLHDLNKARDRLSKLQKQLGDKDKPATVKSAEQTPSPARADHGAAAAGGDADRKTSALDPVPDSNQRERAAQTDRKARLHAQIGEALRDFDIFQQSLCKVDEKLGTSTLSRALTGESLEARLREKRGYILWVKAVVAGGMSHARVSSGSSSLTLGAGAVVSYAIFNDDGTLAEANTVPLYGGKVKVDDLPDAELQASRYAVKKDGDDREARKLLDEWWRLASQEGR